MASIITSAAKSAHAAAATLLEKAQAKPGDKIPITVTVKEQSPAETTTLDLTGRNILVCPSHTWLLDLLSLTMWMYAF